MMNTSEVKKLPSFVFASFGQRFFAYLIDLLLINAFSSLTLTIYRVLGFYSSDGSFSLFNISTILIYLSYFVLLTKYNQGQTLGKMIMRVRVISLEDKELSWSDVFYREWIGRYIQKKIILLYFFYFFTKRKQTTADLITDTVVVSEKKYLDLKDYLALEQP